LGLSLFGNFEAWKREEQGRQEKLGCCAPGSSLLLEQKAYGVVSCVGRLKGCPLSRTTGSWTQVSAMQITSIKSQPALDVDESLVKI